VNNPILLKEIDLRDFVKGWNVIKGCNTADLRALTTDFLVRPRIDINRGESNDRAEMEPKGKIDIAGSPCSFLL
jgi:hypothetical protein